MYSKTRTWGYLKVETTCKFSPLLHYKYKNINNFSLDYMRNDNMLYKLRKCNSHH